MRPRRLRWMVSAIESVGKCGLAQTGELFSRPSVSFGINRALSRLRLKGAKTMNGIIYIIGLIVVVMAILSFFGLR